jgi:hypothetical protein
VLVRAVQEAAEAGPAGEVEQGGRGRARTGEVGGALGVR